MREISRGWSFVGDFQMDFDESQGEIGDFFDARRHPLNDGEVEGREPRRLNGAAGGRCSNLVQVLHAKFLARSLCNRAAGTTSVKARRRLRKRAGANREAVRIAH